MDKLSSFGLGSSVDITGSILAVALKLSSFSAASLLVSSSFVFSNTICDSVDCSFD